MKNIISRSFETLITEGFYLSKELVLQRAIYPMLQELPDGNGKGVYLIPGLANNDAVLNYIKKVLITKGFQAETWGLGMNLGQVPGMERRLYKSFRKFHDTHGKSSVFGHSLGGHIGVALAHHYPKMIDRVITAGGAHNPIDIHPILPHAYKLLTGKVMNDSWNEVIKKGHHVTREVPVFHIIGTKDTLLHPHHTQMQGNPDEHSFFIPTSHGGLLQSWMAAYTLIKLLTLDLGRQKSHA